MIVWTINSILLIFAITCVVTSVVLLSERWFWTHFDETLSAIIVGIIGLVIIGAVIAVNF